MKLYETPALIKNELSLSFGKMKEVIAGSFLSPDDSKAFLPGSYPKIFYLVHYSVQLLLMQLELRSQMLKG